MTGAELLLIGLRLRVRQLDQELAGELSLIVPSATGAIDDLVPIAEGLIKEGHSWLRPWIACARQVEAAAVANEDAVREFMLATYERARELGWTPDRDLLDWVRESSRLDPRDMPAAGVEESRRSTDAGWA